MTKHEDKTHHKKRKQSSLKITLIAIIAIIIVLGLGALIFLKPVLETQKYATYNHFEFEKTQDYWQTHVEYNNLITPITFYSHPLDLENIYFNEDVRSYILGKPHSSFVIAIKEDAGSIPVIAGVNIARILGEKFYGFEVSSALYVENKTNVNTTLPVVNCEDASLRHPIIFISVDGEESSINFSEENNNCIVLASISKEKDDVLPLADLLVYKILEIM